MRLRRPGGWGARVVSEGLEDPRQRGSPRGGPEGEGAERQGRLLLRAPEGAPRRGLVGALAQEAGGRLVGIFRVLAGRSERDPWADVGSGAHLQGVPGRPRQRGERPRGGREGLRVHRSVLREVLRAEAARGGDEGSASAQQGAWDPLQGLQHLPSTRAELCGDRHEKVEGPFWHPDAVLHRLQGPARGLRAGLSSPGGDAREGRVCGTGSGLELGRPLEQLQRFPVPRRRVGEDARGQLVRGGGRRLRARVWGGAGPANAGGLRGAQDEEVREQPGLRRREGCVQALSLPSLWGSLLEIHGEPPAKGRLRVYKQNFLEEAGVARLGLLAASPLAANGHAAHPEFLLPARVEARRGGPGEVEDRADRVPSRGRGDEGAVADWVDAAEREDVLCALSHGVPEHQLGRGRGVVSRHPLRRGPCHQLDDVAERREVWLGPVELYGWANGKVSRPNGRLH